MDRGLYIHLPFCASKCAYCDFYSLPYGEELFDDYLNALLREAEKLPQEKLSTLYLGGGTPSLLGAERIYKLTSFLTSKFGKFEEATLEANPADELYETFLAAKSGGINRISMGVQSANEDELKILSRRHKISDAVSAVESARRAGIENISLDLMLGIPNQTKESLKKSVDFLISLNPQHISSYMLSLEENTPLYKNRTKYTFPTDEQTAEFYLFVNAELENRGYKQYEISNWAKDGFASMHNLNYWLGGEYYCLGASAHGFINGKRYCYSSDIKSFISGEKAQIIDNGGSAQEYLMLSLRLRRGVIFGEYQEKFGKFPESIKEKARLYQKSGLLEIDQNHLALTPQGFLLFNELYLKLTED